MIQVYDICSISVRRPIDTPNIIPDVTVWKSLGILLLITFKTMRSSVVKLGDRMLKGGDDEKVVVKMHKKWNFSVTSCMMARISGDLLSLQKQ